MAKRKKLVVLSGAGMSAESGVSTFRDSGGLWEGHDVMEVATFEGWKKNRSLVLDFYNQRRKQSFEVEPNEGHKIIAELEDHFEVSVITQNVDGLHEKAGSNKVIHLHGELSKAQSTVDPSLVYELDHWEIKEGDKCEKGSQLRPFIVWFGEAVPMMDLAIEETLKAEFFIVIGTSLLVYPAAGLLDFVDSKVPKYIIDPKMPEVRQTENLYLIEEIASEGMRKVRRELAGG
ncbi:MAG: NAD-dependent deacylase [Bacteroidota bacterium]